MHQVLPKRTDCLADGVLRVFVSVVCALSVCPLAVTRLLHFRGQVIVESVVLRKQGSESTQEHCMVSALGTSKLLRFRLHCCVGAPLDFGKGRWLDLDRGILGSTPTVHKALVRAVNKVQQ